MRNKIKQLMNKEEGFTLVELLAVIVILGIIVAISVPAIGSIISDADGKATEAEKELVVEAARLYYVSEVLEDVDGGTSTVTIEQLKTAGYLDTDTTVVAHVTRDADGKLAYVAGAPK